MDNWRALRRRVLTPDVSATKLTVRGFHIKDHGTQEVLETVGRTFLEGYGIAVEAKHPLDAEEPLESIPTRYRGFAYEGATMGFAVLDGLSLGMSRRVATFLEGRARHHIYMALIGVGWAMARLPRLVWPRTYTPDPLLQWLVLDGYGFHQAYFHTDRYVHRQESPMWIGWPSHDPHHYAGRAFDQGVGRALWFVGGASPTVVCQLVERFPPYRRGDLYAGVGLAATYAGAAQEAELRHLLDAAGEHWPQLAQGSVFAAAARAEAGLVVEHNETATAVLCGLSVAQAAKIAADALPEGTDRKDGVMYELWRQRIAAAMSGDAA
jgi:hypothetical protein